MKNMDKAKSGYIIAAIAFVLLTVIAFAAPFTKTAPAFWSGYLFGIIAIGFQIYAFKVAFFGNESAKSKFYGLPVIKVSLLYCVIQFVASIVEMGLAKWMPFWIALIINTIFLAVAAAGTIVNKLVKEEITRQDVVVEKDTANMRNLQKYAAELANLSSGEGKAIVSKVAEELRYSDPVSNQSTYGLEKELLECLEELKGVILSGDVDEIQKMGSRILEKLAERNRVCGLNKK